MVRGLFAFVVVVTAGIWGAGVAPARAEDVAATGDAGRGLALATKLCASCHAIGVDDRSPVAEAPAFRGLARIYPLENLGEALAEGIVTGHEGMPEVELEPDEVEDFLAYLATIQR